MNIYVGNLAREVTEEELRKEFEAYGQVASAAVIKDRFSHESRGFGFVEMPNQDEAKAAISALNSKELKGRKIVVNEARPRTEKRRFNRGGGRGRRDNG